MTERPMWDGGPGEHPDEGTIHAWLDGALDAASAERVAAHVRGCTACSALAAEARGLIAGASRIVSALDDVPAGTRPGWAQVATDVDAAPAPNTAAMERSLWRRLRVTPARAAIAATILVALGVTLTHERVAVDSVLPTATMPVGRMEPRSDTTAGLASAAAPPQKDAMLDSAVAKNLSIAQGTPRVEAAREPAIPRAPAPSAAPVGDAPVAKAEQQVAVGRAAARAERDTIGVLPDRLRVRGEASASAATRMEEAVTGQPARQAQPESSAAMSVAGASVARNYTDAGAKACYSLQSPQGGAMWGNQPLPLVVEVDSGPAIGTRRAAVRSAATAAVMRAAWTRTGRDSVMVTLERIGMSGTIALGPDTGGRAGTATSAATAAALEETAVMPRADLQARAKSAKPSAAPNAAPGAAPSAAANVAPLHVTLRPIDCPTR